MALLDASRPWVLRFTRRVSAWTIFVGVLLIFTSLFTIEAVAQNPPTDFTATPGDKQVTLSWTAPIPSPGYSTIHSYDLGFSSTSTISTFNPITHYGASLTATSATVTGLTNGQTYYFQIKAAFGQSGVEPPEGHSTIITGTPAIPAPTGLRATAGESQVTLSWRAPSPVTTAITSYEYKQDDGTWTPINSASLTFNKSGLVPKRSYTFQVRAARGTDKGTESQTVTVTILRTAPGAPGTLNVERVEDTAILTWSPPSNTGEDIIRYEYSADGGSTWKSTGSSSTRYTVTGLEAGETYTFLIRGIYLDGETSRIISFHSPYSNSSVLSIPKPRMRQDCPVGWVRSDGFAGRNRRALLYEVKVDMDIHNRVSIYKPVWVAIYVHPDEALENLDGWKLQVALPYNRHSEYLLTAENSVVVDAGFVEGGFAFIETPEENPFPMTGMGFPGSPAPGFDYRLYDDSGRRVDFGISCYKRFDIFQVLRNTEDPRVLRKVHLETFDWNSHYLRSEWTVVPSAPAAPSLIKGTIVGTWADLKKQ